MFYPESLKLVRIGRKATNDIPIDKPFFSRVHTTLFFDSVEKCWFLQDGDGESNSTNGTWIFINEVEKVEDGLIVRMGENLLSFNKC